MTPQSGAERAPLIADLGDSIVASVPMTGPADLWPDPDIAVLKEGRRDAPPLPIRIFGPHWSEWLTRAAEGSNSPLDYPAMALLSAGAALIGNARWVAPWENWREPCILWCGLVGDPSSNKSPGIDPLLDLVKTLEGEIAAGFDETHRKWQAEREMSKAVMETWKGRVKEAAKDAQPVPPMPEEAVEPAEPMRPRVIVNDSTPEKLGELLAAHPKGLLFFRDELAGWFGAFDRYSGSGAERALWLEAHGGRKYTIDRVKSERPIAIEHLSVGILGGIQPERLADLMKGAEDGLTARFLWVWPETVPPRRPRLIADRQAALVALRRLAHLRMSEDDLGREQPRVLRLSDEASDTFQRWREEHAGESRGLVGPVAAAWGKAQGQLLRIALVLEHLWWSSLPEADAPGSISVDAITSAAALIEDYIKPMAARVYGDAALPERDRLAAILARWIVRTRPKSINARAVRRTARLPGLKEADKVKIACEALVDADWLRSAPTRQGDSAGRTRDDYVINPKLASVTYGE
jgi:hypothetical protein